MDKIYAPQVSVTVHDLPFKLYEALPAEERENNGTRWKVLESPSSRLVYIRQKD